MTSITINVACPTRALSPNARGHWAALAKAKKEAKYAAYFSAISAMDQARIGRPKWTKATVAAKAYWRDKRSRWDVDNFIASLKAVIDGIASAGLIENDRVVRWGTVDLNNIDKAYPRVELTFTGE